MGKHKQVEIKQHATKRPMGQQRNQRRNQKITQDKWKKLDKEDIYNYTWKVKIL